jgi:hypothetical protein
MMSTLKKKGNFASLRSLLNGTVPSETISMFEWDEKMATDMIRRDSEGVGRDTVTL